MNSQYATDNVLFLNNKCSLGYRSIGVNSFQPNINFIKFIDNPPVSANNCCVGTCEAMWDRL